MAAADYIAARIYPGPYPAPPTLTAIRAVAADAIGKLTAEDLRNLLMDLHGIEMPPTLISSQGSGT